MARGKKTVIDFRQMKKRLSWTRFYLPRGQDWPTWSTGNLEIGPLVDVAGCEKVWVGRQVEDPEQAALIIREIFFDSVWESADALRDFQNSAACDQFLHSLPENSIQTPVTSGTLLQGLFLRDDLEPIPASSAPSRFLSFEWDAGFRFGEDLYGRVTVTALMIPYTGVPNRAPWRRAIFRAFNGFMPADCQDLRVQPPRPRTYRWTACAWLETGDAWVDSDLWQLGPQVPRRGTNHGRAVFCLFDRWQGYNGATPEREDASSKNPLAQESWAKTIAKATPPVVSWEQERWDIQVAPCFIVPEQGEEEEEEEEEEQEEVESEEPQELERQLKE